MHIAGAPSEPRGEILQVPVEPARSQRSQLPPLHALLQQTPSEQKPLWQSRPWLQEAPLTALAIQTPPSHADVGRQSPSLEQEVGQAGLTPLQVNCPQLGFWPTVPAATTVQVPRDPARLQRLQPPWQSVSQQYPSTQLPDWH